MPIEINTSGEIIESDREGHASTAYGLQSREVHELITSKPPFILRSGVGIMFLLAILLLAGTWFIRYPDIVPARSILNSVNAPKEIIARSGGKLVKLMVKEADEVKAGQVLGYIESTADHAEIIRLASFLDTLTTRVNNGETEKISVQLHRRFSNLGELQADYQSFSQAFQSFSNYLQQGFYQRKKQMLMQDMAYLQQLHDQQSTQVNLAKEDLALSDSSFKAHEWLKNEKIISAQEYRNEKSKLIARQMSLPQLNTSIIANESQQHDKQKEIAELDNQIALQNDLFVQALNTFKSEVEDWKKKYLLEAPVGGRVSFARFIQENEELRPGQQVCLVNPGNAVFYAETLVPQYNFGKVKAGQEVLLKFPAYPWEEFGAVKARIEFVNESPIDSGYIAKLSLTDGLRTSSGKQIQYRPGLTAQAEIITSDLRLTERLLNTFRGSVTR